MIDQHVLHDLLTERGLVNWQVVSNVRISGDPNEQVDIIYGYALTASLEEDRIDRKRKRKAEGGFNETKSSDEQPTWSCFLVLPAVSYSSTTHTLSIKRLLELQQCADTNEPSGSSITNRRTFLCLIDAGSISYYLLQAPAVMP